MLHWYAKHAVHENFLLLIGGSLGRISVNLLLALATAWRRGVVVASLV